MIIPNCSALLFIPLSVAIQSFNLYKGELEIPELPNVTCENKAQSGLI